MERRTGIPEFTSALSRREMVAVLCWIPVHLVLLPLVVAVTYELNRFIGRHDNPVTRVLSAPGMWMQNFTTFEPDDSTLEVAIEALTLVLAEVKGEDEW